MGFYDPIKNQTYSNVPAILYFLEKGAQPTGTVHDISKKAEVFKELRINQTKWNLWNRKKGLSEITGNWGDCHQSDGFRLDSTNK